MPRFGGKRASATSNFCTQWAGSVGWDSDPDRTGQDRNPNLQKTNILFLAQSVEEPRAGERPVAVRGAPGDSHRRGGFVQRQAGEEAQFDQLGARGVFAFEFLERVVDGDEFLFR